MRGVKVTSPVLCVFAGGEGEVAQQKNTHLGSLATYLRQSVLAYRFHVSLSLCSECIMAFNHIQQ